MGTKLKAQRAPTPDEAKRGAEIVFVRKSKDGRTYQVLACYSVEHGAWEQWGAPTEVLADNVGAVFRNARAFGADGIVVGPGCCDPLYRKAIRVSIGATLQVPYATCVGPPGFSPVADRGAATAWPAGLLELERAGFTVVALTPAGDAVDLDTFASGPLPDKIALLVGNEGEGLSAGAQRASDVRVRIAMAPGVDSLNVGTATGIALYRLSIIDSR